MVREGECTAGLSPVAADYGTTFQGLSTFVRRRLSHVMTLLENSALDLQSDPLKSDPFPEFCPSTIRILIEENVAVDLAI